MACVSSTNLPHRMHGYTNDHMREQLPLNQNEMRTPSMQIKREYQYHHDYHHYHHPPYPPPYYSEYIQHPIDSLRQQQQQQYAIPFEVAKSPISMSFATIIGAAHAVDRQEAMIHRQEVIMHEHDQDAKQKRPKKTKSKKLLPTISSPQVSFEVELQDPEVWKRLILAMALERPRSLHNVTGDTHEKAPPALIQEGFFWKEYPVLELLLYDHMPRYYEWSTHQRQSKHQQAFNNALVDKARLVATTAGLKFCPRHFTDKKLRDRIRCFFKTHLQNAKKRLQTMMKHLDAPDVRQTLVEMMEKMNDVSLIRTVSEEEGISLSKGQVLKIIPQPF